MNPRNLMLKLSLLLTLGMFPALASALPEDSRAILELRSGKVTFDQKKHYGVFSDHVELDQGSTHIRAFKVITETNDKNQLVKAIIMGQAKELAHYWSLMAENKPPVHAYADQIEYYPNEHLIKLIGHAHIEQGTNSFSAPKITYNIETQKVLTEAKKDQRTLIIFHPESDKSLFKNMNNALNPVPNSQPLDTPS